MIFYKKKYLFIVFILFSISIHAQPFGFGCLGLSGFYAGYSQQYFATGGINEFVAQRLSTTLPSADKIEFKKGTGYRIGANFFRAKWDKFFLTAKGYYQFLKEEHQVSGPPQTGQITDKYQLTMNHWGVGLDFGVPIFWVLDWKIFEANVTFFNTEFIEESLIDNVSQGQIKYTPDKNKLGYFLGSGLILHLVPDYVSIEGTAGYNFITIEAMNNDSGSTIPIQNSTKKAIEKGGLSVTIQLNVGFPL